MLVYGIGISDIGHSDDKCNQKWLDILKRCYSEKFLAKNPTYNGVSVCNEWLLKLIT